MLPKPLVEKTLILAALAALIAAIELTLAMKS